MGCCDSRESPPPLPPRESQDPSLDITHRRAPPSPVERRPTLPPRLASLAADQEARISGQARPPPVPPKIPHLPPRPSSTDLKDPQHWQHLAPAAELAASDQNVPRVHLNRSHTSTLEFDPDPPPQTPRGPTPELEDNPTPIDNAMITSRSMSGSLEHNPNPQTAPAWYRPPPTVSDLDPADTRARSLSPVSATDPMSRQPSFMLGPQAGAHVELEAAGPHIELPAMPEAGPHIELPAVPMAATVCGPVQVYHELDGGYEAVEMPAR